MPSLSEVRDYDGFSERVARLGLTEPLAEVERAITGFELLLEERKHANGTKGIRVSIDDRFAALGGWTKLTVGGIDWRKSTLNGAAIGVEVQVSGRSDLLAVDVLHLKQAISAGSVDAGVIVVPDDSTSRYLTDRTPNLRTAIRHVELHAADLPIRIISFHHDGPGPSLAKIKTNIGRAR